MKTPLTLLTGTLFAGALIAFGATAQVLDTEIARASVPQLAAAYLACDEEATRSMLDFGRAAACSQIAEALKARGFNGDFEALLQWWRAAKAERTRLASATVR